MRLPNNLKIIFLLNAIIKTINYIRGLIVLNGKIVKRLLVSMDTALIFWI